MPVDVVECRLAGGHRLWLRFDDGVVGEVDVAALVPFRGALARLAWPEEFAKARVDRVLGTVVWPFGADLDPDLLHARVTARPLEAA